MTIACSTAIGTSRRLPDVLEQIAMLGFDAVEIMCFPGWAHLEPADLVEQGPAITAEVLEVLGALGLQTVGLNTKPSGEVNSSFASDQEQHAREAAALCALAEDLGAAVVTVPAGSLLPGVSAEEAVALSVRALQQWVAAADDHGVRLAIETHQGSLAEQPAEALQLLEAVPGLWITYDPSHYTAAGVPLSASLPLFDRIAHCHLRNARLGCFQERMDRGLLDLDWVLRNLNERGYEGAISIEYLEDFALRDGYNVEFEVAALRQYLLPSA